MKRRLLPKILLSYILFGILGFLTVAWFSSRLIEEYNIKRQAVALYRESNLIANQYGANYYNTTLTLPDLESHLSIIESYMDANIWLVGTRGTILINSNSTPASSSMSIIENFDPTSTGSSYYQIGTYYDCFKQDMLSVTSPITVNYKIKGYLVTHYPMEKIYATSNQLLNIVYLTYAVIFLCSFVIFFLFFWQFYLPLSKITTAALEYSEGNFDYQLNVNSSDELGYLSACFSYMSKELNTLEDYQKKFISNISHDFRSPLTSIKGYVEAIADGTIPPENQEKYLKTILYETDRLNKLTQSLLTLNDVASKRNMLDITDFDINSVIKQTAATFEGTCTKKKISIELILTGNVLYVSADMGKIQQVLYNLIDNAIKFSHDNSVIKIETTVKNEKVFLSVKDTGIGIPKDSQKKIFERFYKTDLSRGKDKKGTGLGLSIVKEIIQSHNENINIISTEGVGTEFLFTLAKSKEAPKNL